MTGALPYDLEDLESGHSASLAKTHEWKAPAEDAIYNGQEPPGDQDERTSWWPVDLGPVLKGEFERPQPSVGMRTDLCGIFYRGRSHSVVGETESAKTWFALAVAADELWKGEHVVYLDWEDDEGTIVDRLLLIMRGARNDTEWETPEEVIEDRFHYIRPEGDLRVLANARDLAEVMHTYKPSLVVSDGTTAAMSVHDLNPIDNADVATFKKILIKPLIACGTTFVALDHVTKSREGRGRYALGGVDKLNQLTGAGFALENIKPFGIGLKGRSRILITKDRLGQLRANGKPSIGGMYTYGDLVLDARTNAPKMMIYPPWPDEEPEPGDPFAPVEDDKPVEIMTKIAAFLNDKGEQSKRKIVAGVRGYANTKIVDALDVLILDGHVSDESPHKLIKPYPGVPFTSHTPTPPESE